MRRTENAEDDVLTKGTLSKEHDINEDTAIGIAAPGRTPAWQLVVCGMSKKTAAQRVALF
jgi:N-acetylmuramic acid 6-phosphate (MurNAc-6-P) etherase